MESLNSKKQLQTCPREKANLLSYITFAWAIPIFLKGRNQTIGEDDLFQPLTEQKASGLANKIKISWNKEEEKCRKTNKKPWLVSALKSVFGYEVLFQGLFLFFIECGLKILPPIFLNQIIKYHEDKDEGSEPIMYWSTFGITLCIFLNVIIMHAFNLSNLNLGLKVRIAVSTLIYDKCLQLSKISLSNVSLGKIVNLLSSDVGRFDSTAFGFHYLWVGPIQTVLVTYLIYNEIGWSAFGGVALILIMIPLQLFLGKTAAMLRMKTAIRTDKRIKLMNEIIQGIQTIKMYAWEKPMATLISQTRGKEIRMVRFVSWIKGITLSLMLFSSRVSIFTSLIIYAILGNFLTAQKAFVVTAYYNVLRQTMVIMYPLAINNVMECLVAIQRIEQLLFITDKNRDEKRNKSSKISSTATFIKMQNVFAKWKSQSPEMTLTDITIEMISPSLTIIAGRVGSGKSSLIQALLYELPIETGEIAMNGKISYASQVPWLFSGSVKQNIVFGLPFDKNRYNSVIKACALSRDFELWVDGDETIIGERGMSLSGGQKARISLARAIYREADIYLLDDQLSAVDSHVQKHLFENCIKDFLKDKIVVLVTHQLQYLPSADQIILLENGKILAKGNFETLRNTGLDFTKYLPKNIDEIIESEVLKRQISKEVQKPLQKQETKKVDRSEKRAEGSIGWKIYNEYFQATGGYLVLSFIMLFFVIAQLMASASDYFVSYWVSKESQRENENQLVNYDRNVDIYIFSALTLATVLLTFGRSFMFFNVAMRASRRLHDAMFDGISRAKMFFFNTNPSGRILNRFSKDLNQIDEQLPFIMIDLFQIIFSFLGTIGVLAVVNQFYLIPTFILFIIFYQIRQIYLKISLDVKRLSSTTSSPVFSYLSETLTGLSTVRAFNIEDHLKSEFFSHLDLNTSSHYIWLAMTRTFAFWLDMCCFIYIAIVIISFFFTDSSSGNVGLAITQAMTLTNMVQLGMRNSAVLENLMTAVERVVEYQTVDPEPAFESEVDKKPPKEWPQNGQIKFDKLSLSYFPDMEEKVLKELEFEINPQEKIGIVGRTGAGKSSIINALFRLSYLNGNIEIDMRNTAQMGLHDLRSKISIIPQEPVLFSNTMRYNLDPFDEYSDEKLWSALEEVNLKRLIKDTPAGLNMEVTEGGTNLSVGERQLVCLARAILRENKIIVMDEATANVDYLTDETIQKTIRQKFESCTLIMIAHRLNSVMDSDRILVMDAGKCVEFGSPYDLLNKTEETRYFYEMLKNTGKGTFESLKKIAEENHFKKKMK